MSRYSSTGLNEASKHCPKALDLLVSGSVRDRRHFEAGTAAHAFLQSAGELARLHAKTDPPTEQEYERRWLAVASLLVGTGRVFNGHPEPPLSPDGVFSGLAIVREYIRWRTEPMSPTAQYEIGLAVDSDGRPVPYNDPSARLTGIVDVQDGISFEDEETAARGLLVRDYKSAWPTSADELDTLQRKAQAILAWRNLREPLDFIRLEVVNLRTWKTYARDIFVSDGLEELLALWWGELTVTMDALDAMNGEDGRPAIPSGGCIGCAWALRCPAGQKWIADCALPPFPDQRAEFFALAKQQAELLGEALRQDTADEPIELTTGELVGTVGTEARTVKDDAPASIAETWELSGGKLAGFAVACGLTVGNLEAIGKVIHPKDRAERNKFIDEHVTMSLKRRFGIHPKPASTDPTHAQEVTKNATASEV